MSKKYDDFMEALEKLCEEHDVQIDFNYDVFDSYSLCVLPKFVGYKFPRPLSDFIENKTTTDQS